MIGQRQEPRGCIIDNIDMCGYESHKQMVNKMMNLQKRFPNIAKVNLLNTLIFVLFYSEN